MKKLRIKNIVKTIILLILFIDLLHVFYNMVIGAMITYFGILTLVIELASIYLLIENLKKYYR